jgi:hypothetical protein
MKKRLLLRIASIVGVAAMLFTLTACHEDTIPMPINTLPFGEQVRQYLERDQQSEGSSIVEGQYAAYFDYSDGMQIAYNTEGINTNLDRVAQTVINDKCEVYCLESGEVKSMVSMSKTDLYNDIIKKKKELNTAPIEDALKKIVADKKPALLVTDFEEYKKGTGITDVAYAFDYLKGWLDLGGTIKFYIMDYKENKLAKKLFFVVFDSKSGKLTEDINFAMKNAGQGNYKPYDLKTTPYKVFTDYAVGKGGLFCPSNVKALFGPFQYALLEEKNVETYYFEKRSWLQVVEGLMDYRYDGFPQESFSGLLSNLYVDVSDTQSRNISKVETKVTDITDDFKSYTDYQFALKYAPTKGEDGSVTLSDEQAYFYDGEGNLLPKWKYNPSTLKDITKEHFLDVNQEIFGSSCARKPEKAEIVVDFGPEFTDSTLCSHPAGYVLLNRDKGTYNGRVLRVDICIAESGVDDYSKLDDFFGFETDGHINRCLAESVVQTLRKYDIGGRVIYTYIIKDNPNAEEE